MNRLFYLGTEVMEVFHPPMAVVGDDPWICDRDIFLKNLSQGSLDTFLCWAKSYATRYETV